MRELLFSILIFLSYEVVYSQNTYHGTVSDASGNNGIEDVTISLLNNKKNVFDYTYTGKDGKFKITTDSIPRFIMMNCLGYERIVIAIDDFKNGGKYSLENKEFKIKEVRISSNRIREKADTIVYSVSGFQMPQDRTIADVLKKMPGIEVLPSGQIKFEDKAISKLYIDGVDLMGNRYALATNNVSKKVIKEVQVLRNHQAISVLRNKSFTDQAALNLVLVDEARYSYTGSVDIGAGYSQNNDFLWDMRLLGLLFGKKQQNLSLYKTNNIGENISNEVNVQNKMSTIETPTLEPILSFPSIYIKGIDEQHYLQNKSHLFATNQLFKINNSSTIRGQFSYTRKLDNQTRDKSTTYFYPNEIITVIDDNNLRLELDSYNAEIDYQLNDKKQYIRNYTTASINNNNANNNVVSNNTPINSKTHTHPKTLSNLFQLICTYGTNKVLKILSNNSFQDSPQKLLVTPGLYDDILNNGKPYNGFIQDVSLRNFYSNTVAEVQHKVAGFYMNLNVGIAYNYQKMSSELYCKEGESISSAPSDYFNNLSYTDTKIYATPSMQYKDQHWELKLNIPISYHQYRLNYKIDTDKEKMTRIWVEPVLNAIYDLDAYWRMSNTLTLNYQVPDINELYINYIFTNYRNAFSGSGFYDSKSLIYNCQLKYSNPLNGFFGSISGNITSKWQDKMLASYQDGILSSYEMFDKKHRDLSWNIRTRISKSFGWNKLFTAFTGSYGQYKTKNLLAEEVIPFHSDALTLALNASLQPSKFISIDANTKYLYSTLTSSITPNVYSESFQTNVSVNIFPTANWTFKCHNQLMQSKKPIYSSIYFLDLSSSYLWKKVEIELCINNLLNKRNFKTTTYTQMTESTTLNYFRSREFLVKLRMNI